MLNYVFSHLQIKFRNYIVLLNLCNCLINFLLKKILLFVLEIFFLNKQNNLFFFNTNLIKLIFNINFNINFITFSLLILLQIKLLVLLI